MVNSPYKHIFYYTPAIGWGILICYFSLIPSFELPGLLLNTKDVILHFSIYLILALLFVLANNRFTIKPVENNFIYSVLLGILVMGSTIEVIQGNYVEGRQFEWSDILFNTLGSLFAFIINLLFRHRQAESMRS